MADFIPDSHENRLAFFINLKAQTHANAVALGLDAADLAAADALLIPLITTYQTLVDAENAVVAAAANAAQLYSQQSEALRAFINNLKNNTKFTDGMGTSMNVFTKTTAHDPNAIKPKIKAEAFPGSVRITGSKAYAELVNIYTRIGGTTSWRLVGIQRKKFPFDDQTPLKTPGMAETREYAARGVINDEEVGEMSDIVQVAFAG